MSRTSSTTPRAGSRRNRRLRRDGLATIAALSVAALAAYGVQAGLPAQALTGEESRSSAVFLDGAALGIPLDSLVGIEGASAEYIDGTTAGDSVVDDAGLDATALSALNIGLPGLEVAVGDLLQLGAITQQATASPNGASTASTSTAELGVDLTSLLGANTGVISEGSIGLGAVQSTATLAEDGTLTRTTTIADATANLTSPLLADAVGTVTTAVDAVNTAVNGLSTTLTSTIQSTLGALGAVTTNPLTVTSRLDDAVSDLLGQTLTSGLVSLTPATGELTLNLAGGIDLNDIPPNSTLLSPELLQQITADLADLAAQLQTDLNGIVDNALDYIDLDLGITVNPPLLPDTANISITYDGTLADFVDGTQDLVITDPTGLLGLLAGTLQATLAGVVSTALDTAVAALGTAVDGVVTALTDALAPVLDTLTDVVAVNLNVQNDSDGIASAASVSAVQIVALGGVLDLPLVTSTVGPNVQLDFTPTVAAEDVVAGESTPVTGGGWPADTDVSLQVTDADGAPIGDPIVVTTDADGAIPAGTLYPIPVDAPPGTYTVTGTALDGAGTPTTLTAEGDFAVTDETAPDAPVIETPEDGSTIGDATPEISGTGEPGATIELVINGTPIDTSADPIVVGEDGTWTYTPTTELPDGENTVSATQTDPSGNESPADSTTFTVDTDVPVAPVIETPEDGSTISDPTPEISGTGEPGATITLTLDGTPIDTSADPIVVGADGTWTYTPAADIADGEHTVTATQTDEAGNTSPADSTTFTIDTAAPEPPVITGPADQSTITTLTPEITGTGEAGSTITLTIDGEVIDTTTDPIVVDENGTWTYQTTEELADGSHTVSATQTDEGGNTSGPSDEVEFFIDTTADPAPVIEAPVSGSSTNDTTPTVSGTGVAGSFVTVTASDGTVLSPAGGVEVGEDGTWSFDSIELAEGTYTITATQDDGLGNVSGTSNSVIFTVDLTAPEPPVIETPADGSATNDTTPEISGTGEPGATITLVIDGTPVDTSADPIVVGEDGTWTYTPTTPLAEGDHTVDATQTDEAGNESGPAEQVGFTIDTVAPEPPVIETPADGSTTPDSTPDVTGSGEPGSTITLIIDGTPVDTSADPIVVGEDGTWTYTPTTPLADGEHTIDATQTDAAGNESDPAEQVTFTVDTVTPDAPAITSPADGDVTNDDTPEITGTGEPGATITLVIDGTPVDTSADPIVVGEDGTWTYTPTTPLAEGDHTIDATQTDAAGHESGPAEQVTFEIDVTAPDAPVISSPADGSTIADSTPLVTGTGEPGATVEVSIDGTVVGTADVDEDGNWELQVEDPLADGDHTVSATQTDPAGNTSEAAANDFTIDATAPQPPVITGPDDGAIVPDAQPPITGTAEPGTTVTVTITNPDGTETVFDDVPVSDTGDWTVTPDEPLSEGEHTITATATDDAGNESDPSAPVTITVDTADPAAPVITAPADGSVTNDSTPAITGTSETGTTVDLTITGPDGTIVIEDVPVVDGQWTYTPTSPLADGDYTVTAVATDDAGNVSPASDPVDFAVDTVAPDAPVITSPTDGQVTGDTTPAITGTGEPGATVEVIIDGEPVGETTVDEDGNWTFTPDEPLADGDHTVSATQTDEAGNTSPASPEVTFTIDSSIPAVDITSPAPGDLTNDSTPAITGTGEPGATITVIVDGEELGETTVDEDGNWTFTPDEPLADGDHEVEVVAEDDAGNTATDGPIAFTVDTTAPDAPVITSPADGDTVTDLTPDITGTGEPGSTITVIIDGDPVGETTVDEDGNWTFTPDEPLAEGDHTITATATDPAGNVSDPSAPVTITVPSYEPSISVPDQPAYPGSEIPVNGSGYPPNTEVTVQLTGPDGNPVGDPITVVTDDEGGFEVVVTVPEDAAPGEYTVVGSTDDGLTAETPVTVFTPSIDAGGPVAPGDDLPVTGGGFPPNTEIEVVIRDGDGNPVGDPVTVVTDENGDFSKSIPIPDGAAPGDYTVVVTTPDGSEFTDDVVITGPIVAGELGTTGLTPQVERGDQQSICGTGFAPGETVTAVQHSEPLTIGTATADENGRVCFTWTIRADEAFGTHTVTLTGQLSGEVSATFEVVPSGLAATGALVWPGLALGTLILGTGALLMVLRRRRQEA